MIIQRREADMSSIYVDMVEKEVNHVFSSVKVFGKVFIGAENCEVIIKEDKFTIKCKNCFGGKKLLINDKAYWWAYKNKEKHNSVVVKILNSHSCNGVKATQHHRGVDICLDFSSERLKDFITLWLRRFDFQGEIDFYTREATILVE